MLTGSNSHLSQALSNVDRLTSQILSQDQIGKTLANLQSTSQDLNHIVRSVGPRVDIITANLQEVTETVKRQPWRLIWPSTAKYPSPSPRPGSVRRRSSP